MICALAGAPMTGEAQVAAPIEPNPNGVMNMVRWTMRAAALTVAALVAACGGGDKAPITSVKVMGDSLADSGTFGLKFTVQGAAHTRGALPGPAAGHAYIDGQVDAPVQAAATQTLPLQTVPAGQPRVDVQVVRATSIRSPT